MKRARRNVLVRLLVTPTERRELQRAAKRAGMTLSAWIRYAAWAVASAGPIQPPPARLSRAQRKREREAERIGIEETLIVEQELAQSP